ncbi:NTP transferase domain-containing protein [Patescibacteria group bacterium]|nr:NTP transferase domain-containing protein [Patescibacteria group bacterium]
MVNKGRSRITITLRKDLIPFLDQTIDGTKIRNRSHAIEYILGKYLQGPKIRQAVILAGGKGVQMRPLTYEMPKTMIPVHGKHILQHIIETLRDQRIRDITVLIGHLGEMIQDHFKDGSKFGVKITYEKEKHQYGTAGSLRQLKNKLNDSFLLIYGDVLSEVNFIEFIEFHKSHNQIASMALTSQDHPTEYGVVNLQGSKSVKFEEKPEKKPGLSHLINAGMYILEPNIFKYIPPKGYVSLEQDVLPDLAKKGRLFGYPFSGQWFDVATPEIYESVIKEWPIN